MIALLLLGCADRPPHPPALRTTRMAAGELRRSAGDVSRPAWSGTPVAFERTLAPTATLAVEVAGAAEGVQLRLVGAGGEVALAASARGAGEGWQRWEADLSALAPGRWQVEVAVAPPLPASAPVVLQDRDDGRHPNVLLVVIDTLRADHLGCYGHDRPTSPRIDAFAAEAVRFAHATSQASWTLPSMATLLTGRYPESHGVVHRDHRVADALVTVAERFAEAGYATGAIVSGTFTDATWGMDQGFDAYDDLGAITSDLRPVVADPSAREEMVAAERRITSPEVTDRAIRWLAEHRDRRFFLMAHYFDPHAEFLEHPGVSERFPPRPVPVRLALSDAPRPDDLALRAARYEGEIAFTDRHVGRLLDALAAEGLADDTIVVITSDHGEEFHERLRAGHGHGLFGELVRVPLIVRAPGVAPGVATSPVGLVDLAPTLLELCGLPPLPGAHGRSLAPQLRDPGRPRGLPVYAAGFPPGPPAEARTDAARAPQREFRVDDDRHAFVRIEGPGPPRAWLFDRADPEERESVLERGLPRARALEDAYGAFRAAARAERPPVEPIPLGGVEAELEALGYGADR